MQLKSCLLAGVISDHSVALYRPEGRRKSTIKSGVAHICMMWGSKKVNDALRMPQWASLERQIEVLVYSTVALLCGLRPTLVA